MADTNADLQKQKQWGIQFLLEQAKRISQESSDPHRTPTYLERHPFDLDVPRVHSTNPFFEINFKLVGYPGYTDASVDNIAMLIAERLTFSQVVHLRVLLGKLHPENYHDLRPRHDVYFEVGFHHGEVFIAGGCNDFSGAGSHGKDRMDALFALLNGIYSVETETVVIPMAKAERGRRYMESAVNNREK